MTKLDLADMLERFIGDAASVGEWDWDALTSMKASPELEPYRRRLLQEENQPPGNERELREIIAELRTNA